MSYNSELVAQIMATGEPASREENDELYAAVIAGDKAAARRMIEGNMPLVLLRVDAYIRCFPGTEHLRDDMASAGFVGLCTAVAKLGESEVREHSNATGYLNYWINASIGEVVDSDGGVGACARTVRNHRKASKVIVKKVVEDVEDVRPDEIVDPMSMPDLRDLIDACCESDEDRTIVRMRLEQYPCGSDREIALALSLPYSTVYMMRREIYSRFLEKSGMSGEV